MRHQRPTEALTRRERQVMDILFRRGASTVAEVMAELPDPPGYSSVRSVLRILVRRQLVAHHEDGPRYVYAPVAPQSEAREHALKHVVRTFFGGSAEQAVAALLKIADVNVGPSEMTRLREQIRKTRESGR